MSNEMKIERALIETEAHFSADCTNEQTQL